MTTTTLHDGHAAGPFVQPARDLSYLWRRGHNTLVIALGDVLALGFALLAAAGVRTLVVGEPHIPAWAAYLLIPWWLGNVTLGLLPGWGMGTVEELRRVTLLLAFMFAGLAVLLFLTQRGETVSRLTLSTAFATSLMTVLPVRLGIKRLLSMRNAWGVPAAIYGAGQTGRLVIERLQNECNLGYAPAYLFDDDPHYWGHKIHGVKVLGSTSQIVDDASVAILAIPSLPQHRLIELLEGPLSAYRTVLVIPNLVDAPSLWVHPRDLNGLLGVEITCNLMDPLARFSKRLLDLVLTLATAPIWMPLCVGIALMIWYQDRASPLFLQERVGRDGRLFQTWKFRTMIPNAEDALSAYLDAHPDQREEWEQHHKLRHDPRVTALGRFLRRTSLDELPQLVNVLRGEMSIVGPRPLPWYHHTELPSQTRDLRERVRPGITGLWQVSGRSDASMEGFVRWDPYYVRNWSCWLDTVILFRSIRVVITGTGAY